MNPPALVVLLCSICRCKMNRVTWLLCQLLIYVIYLLTFSYLLKVFYFYNNSPIVGYKICHFRQENRTWPEAAFFGFFLAFFSPMVTRHGRRLYPAVFSSAHWINGLDLVHELPEITSSVRFGKISYNPCTGIPQFLLF